MARDHLSRAARTASMRLPEGAALFQGSWAYGAAAPGLTLAELSWFVVLGSSEQLNPPAMVLREVGVR